MKLLVVICILVSSVNSLPNEDPSVYDYFDFAEIPRIATVRTPRQMSFDSAVSASERSDFGSLMPSQSANRRSYLPGISTGRRIGGVGASNRRPVAPVHPLLSLGREVHSRPINQRRFTQNNYADYDAGSPSFNQPRFRPQQSYRPQTDNKPSLRPSQQYFPEQQYRPEYSRPQPQFRKQPQYVAEPQYRPNQYRPNPKPQYTPDSQITPNYAAQIEEPIYQDSVDYQDLPITYEETPILKTKKYVFDEKPSIKNTHSQYADESLPYQNEQPQYHDESPKSYQNEQPQYHDESPKSYQNEQPQYQPYQNEQPQYHHESPKSYQNEQPQYQDENPKPYQNEQAQYHDESPKSYQNEQPQYQEEYPQYDELPVYQDYVQEQPRQQDVSQQNVELNRHQSQATVNALPVQDKEAQESVIEKRQVGLHGDLDAAGQAFAADAAAVENAKDAGRLAFQIHGQQGPHSYRFGYDTGKGPNRQFRYEERDGKGEVHGRYGFYDESGKLKVVNYSAHPKHGFSADVPKDR